MITTGTPALLPPDPSVPGRYWIASAFEGIWSWNQDTQRWHAPGWTPNRISPELAATLGCTLASRHPIPGPAALDALHKLVREIHDRQPKHEMRILRSSYDGRMVLQRSMSASAYADAAAMLRAALEAKETT